MLMQIFFDQRLAFLAVPKSGSTSVEIALRPYASVDVAAPPRDRHMPARRFLREYGEQFRETFGHNLETFAVLRHPIARLESWYRYRQSETRRARTVGLTFDEFVRLVVSDRPPEPARIGSQDNFVLSESDEILIDHLFCIESLDLLEEFLERRFGTPVKFRKMNASRHSDTELSHETRTLLRKERFREFALFELVRSAGYLCARPCVS